MDLAALRIDRAVAYAYWRGETIRLTYRPRAVTAEIEYILSGVSATRTELADRLAEVLIEWDITAHGRMLSFDALYDMEYGLLVAFAVAIVEDVQVPQKNSGTSFDGFYRAAILATSHRTGYGSSGHRRTCPAFRRGTLPGYRRRSGIHAGLPGPTPSSTSTTRFNGHAASRKAVNRNPVVASHERATRDAN